MTGKKILGKKSSSADEFINVRIFLWEKKKWTVNSQQMLLLAGCEEKNNAIFFLLFPWRWGK